MFPTIDTGLIENRNVDYLTLNVMHGVLISQMTTISRMTMVLPRPHYCLFLSFHGFLQRTSTSRPMLILPEDVFTGPLIIFTWGIYFSACSAYTSREMLQQLL